MEIVVRAVVIFFFLWLITRILGRSTLGELSTFQLIVFITMGDLIQQSVTQQDFSVTAGMLAVGTFALLTIGLSWINARSPRLRPVTHGTPVTVMHDGEPLLAVLRSERLALDDLVSAARQQGIERLSDIRVAVLETNGQISFFTRSSDAQGSSARTAAG